MKTMLKRIAIFLAVAASAGAALAACADSKFETMGYAKLTTGYDTITAECNFDKKTLDINGTVVHISAPTQAVKLGRVNVFCDAQSRHLVISY